MEPHLLVLLVSANKYMEILYFHGRCSHFYLLTV